MCIKLFSSMGKVSQTCDDNTYNEIIFCVSIHDIGFDSVHYSPCKCDFCSKINIPVHATIIIV